MNTEGYTCFMPQMGTDYRITPYSYITSFVCYHPEDSESKATRKISEISEISVLQKISFACFSLATNFRQFASIPCNEFTLVNRLNRLNR